jgi:hypothetical protein
MGKSQKQAHARKAITKRNLTYFRWRYVRNAGRTLRAWLDRPSFDDSVTIAEEMSCRGIVVGASDTYLSAQGRQASEKHRLMCSLSLVVHEAINAGSSGGSKEYLVQLIPFAKSSLRIVRFCGWRSTRNCLRLSRYIGACGRD